MTETRQQGTLACIGEGVHLGQVDQPTREYKFPHKYAGHKQLQIFQERSEVEIQRRTVTSVQGRGAPTVPTVLRMGVIATAAPAFSVIPYPCATGALNVTCRGAPL